MSKGAESTHAPDCNCHVCQPYSEWLDEPAREPNGASEGLRCTCQYGTDDICLTPYWYITVKTCPLHAHLYDASQAPEWWDVASNSYVGPKS